MATEAGLIAKIRSELGDFAQPFRTTYRGDGATDYFDLPATNVGGLVVTQIVNNVPTVLAPAAYTINSREGLLDLTTAPPDNSTILVEGTSTGLFTDAELAVFLRDAMLQHTHGATTRVRYRDADGFVRYSERPVTVETLPPVEELLVAILATVEALWVLSTDASTDVDVSTAEGTFLPRSQRYAQIRSQIDVLTAKYTELALALNVGLKRIEMSTLRRVSRMNGRLVPLYTEREFDDHTWPERILPPIDSRHSERDASTADTVIPTVDFDIVAGDYFERDLDFGFDLTGYTVKASARGWTHYYQGLNAFTVVVTNAVLGLVRISLSAYQTAHLGPGAQYDVEITNPQNQPQTYLRGRLWFDPQVTPSGTVVDGQVAIISPYNIAGWTVQDQNGLAP